MLIEKDCEIEMGFVPCKDYDATMADRLRDVIYNDTMAGPLLSDTVQEDGCDDRPCPKPFRADAFHQGPIESPGSLAGSCSQASNCYATESDSNCSATKIADGARVLTVDVSHSQPKEPDVISRRKDAVAQEKFVAPHLNHTFGSRRSDKKRLFNRMQKMNYRARVMRLMPKDFKDFGMTMGCPKCDELRGFGTSPSAKHSQQCRDRIAGELAKTAHGQDRLALQSWRMDVVVRERNKCLGYCC